MISKLLLSFLVEFHLDAKSQMASILTTIERRLPTGKIRRECDVYFMTRQRTVKSRKELEDMVDEYVEKGYKVKRSNPEEAIVKERTVGSWVIHIILLIFTIGFGNVIYLLYSWITADTVEINLNSGDRI